MDHAGIVRWMNCVPQKFPMARASSFRPRATLKGPKRSFVDRELRRKFLKEALLFLLLAWNQAQKKFSNGANIVQGNK